MANLKIVSETEPLVSQLRRLEAEASSYGIALSKQLVEVFRTAYELASSAQSLTSVPVGIRQEAKVLAKALEGARTRIEAILERQP